MISTPNELRLWEDTFRSTGKVPSDAFAWKNDAGEHVLTWAYLHKKWSLAYALIEQGFDVNQQDHDGLTILHDFYLPFEAHQSSSNPFWLEEWEPIAVTGKQTLEYKNHILDEYQAWMTYLREKTELNPLIQNKWGETASEWWGNYEKWKSFNRLMSMGEANEWMQDQASLWTVRGEKLLLQKGLAKSTSSKLPPRI